MDKAQEAAGVSSPAGRRVTEYVLRYPIEKADGSELTRVLVRRPRGADMRAAAAAERENDPVTASYAMIAGLTGLTIDDVDQMDAEDVTGLSRIVESFFLNIKTGER
jgi:hypothetical protein